MDFRDSQFVSHRDADELKQLFPSIQAYQALAEKHGINDIFQDNGGKILQLCLLLGIEVLPGREGNDARSPTTGAQFELKTLNINNNGGWTTHHHLNFVILEKYRQVSWIFAAYRGIELVTIWHLSPEQMRPMFADWAVKLKGKGEGGHINNPKIPRRFVVESGPPIWQAPGGRGLVLSPRTPCQKTTSRVRFRSVF